MHKKYMQRSSHRLTTTWCNMYQHAKGKARYDLLDPEVTHGQALVFTFGQEKGYEANSWQKIPPAKYIAAYQRHMREHLRGNYFDEESNLLHIDHAIANLAILRWHATQNKKVKKQMEGKYD